MLPSKLGAQTGLQSGTYFRFELRIHFAQDWSGNKIFLEQKSSRTFAELASAASKDLQLKSLRVTLGSFNIL